MLMVANIRKRIIPKRVCVVQLLAYELTNNSCMEQYSLYLRNEAFVVSLTL